MTKFHVGDRVKYTDAYLKIVGRELASLRGTVIDVLPSRRVGRFVIPERVKIDWKDGAILGTIACNLVIAED